MNGKRWLAMLISVCVLQLISFSTPAASAETSEQGNQGNAPSPNDVEITVGGVPVEDLIGAAAGMFADALESNMSEAIDGLNGVFGEFAKDMSGDLGEIERKIGSMIDDTWLLSIPAISLYTEIGRSVYDNALDLYQAQICGEIGKEGKIASNSTEDCGNSIIYIYDESEFVSAILESVENGTFGEREIIFGLDGFTGTYEAAAVLYLAPSDEPYAMCNMTDLSDERQFDAYRDYIIEKAEKVYDDSLEYGDRLVTIIFWNEDTNADWLTVVAKEVPMMLD